MEDKSSGILCTLHILKKHSNKDNPLTNNQIISYLKSDYGVSISANTLRHHINNLCRLGYPISTFEENRKGIYLDSEDEYDDEEIKVLIDSVLTSHYIPANQAKSLINKLTKLASKDFPKRLDYIEPVDDWNHRDNKSFFWNLACLTDAIAENKMVSFFYNEVSTKGILVKQKTPKKAQPLAVVCSLGQYYLICRFWNKKDIYHYRIDRMTDVKMLDIAIPEDERTSINLARYSAEHHFMYGGKIVRVVLKMPTKLAGNILDHFGKRARIVDLGNGTMEVHVDASEKGMLYFALQYGASGCEVLSPPSLRNEVKKSLKEMIKRYEAL